MSLAIDAVLVRERLYDAVDLRAAERGVARVAVLVARSFYAMLAYLVEEGLWDTIDNINTRILLIKKKRSFINTLSHFR